MVNVVIFRDDKECKNVSTRSVAKGGPRGPAPPPPPPPPSVAKVGPGPPTFLRLCPYFAFDTRLAESAVARLAISTRMAII